MEKNNGHFKRQPERVTACISKCNLLCIYYSEHVLSKCCDSFHMFLIMNRNDLIHTIMTTMMMIIIVEKKTTLIITNDVYYTYMGELLH